MSRKTFGGLAMLVLTVVVTAGCAGDISGEQAVLKSKMDKGVEAYQDVFPELTVKYNFYGTSVDIILQEPFNITCTYKLNDSKTAWLLVGGDECAMASISVP
jgi:hypothetical protein